jgi:hypothetical protein
MKNYLPYSILTKDFSFFLVLSLVIVFSPHYLHAESTVFYYRNLDGNSKVKIDVDFIDKNLLPSETKDESSLIHCHSRGLFEELFIYSRLLQNGVILNFEINGLSSESSEFKALNNCVCRFTIGQKAKREIVYPNLSEGCNDYIRQENLNKSISGLDHSLGDFQKNNSVDQRLEKNKFSDQAVAVMPFRWEMTIPKIKAQKKLYSQFIQRVNNDERLFQFIDTNIENIKIQTSYSDLIFENRIFTHNSNSNMIARNRTLGLTNSGSIYLIQL